MKKVLFAILLMAPMAAWATKPTPGPADFTITVHVQSSEIIVDCSGGGCSNAQQLSVVIDGKKYELLSNSVGYVLRVGDYKARIVKDESARAYEYLRTYQFQFADGKTRQYTVVGESE